MSTPAFPQITDTRPVFTAWVNTDLTEGKGAQYPLAVCTQLSTAIRLGKGQDVQGCDAAVHESRAVKIDGVWLGPIRLIYPTREDEDQQKKIDMRAAALEKAKAAGLTPEEIQAIQSK